VKAYLEPEEIERLEQVALESHIWHQYINHQQAQLMGYLILILQYLAMAHTLKYHLNQDQQ